MINIIVNSDGLVFEGAKKINTPLNSVILLLEKASDIVMFKSSIDYDTIIQEKWQNITINGEPVTKENIVDKFNEIANVPQGGGTKINAGTNITLQPQEDGSITISATGELGGTVAWADVTDKPETFTPSAHTHLSADITDLQGKLDAKQDTLVSGESIKTINGESILGSGNIVIEGGTGDVTQQYVDEQLDLKVDKTAYEADKATFALKTEIPSIEGLASKEELQNGLDGKQDKGDYALKSELPDISGLVTKTEVDETYAKKSDIPDTSDFATKEELASKADASALSTKQDTLVSGTNIKTINGQTLLGEGNIEIQGGGGGIADAPSDGKKYVRQNANWVEETTVDTSNFATKAELDGKVDDAEIADMLTKTEASSTYQPKGDYLTAVPDEYVTESELSGKGYLTEIPSEYVTDEELNGKGYATTSQLDSKLDIETYNSDKATFATKEELAGKANTSDLSNYLQTSVAESTYAKKSEIPEEYTLPIATAEALGGIKVGAGLSINPETGVLNATGGGTADSVDWANITSKPSTFTPSAHNHPISEVTDLQTNLDAKADKTAIADMATKTWVGEQGYLTSIPEEYVTETELSGKGYLTSIPEEYVTNEELTSALSSKQDKGNYITVETADGKYQVKGDYATKSELANKVDTSAYTEDKATFALKSELTNLATKEELNLKANSSDLSNYLTTDNAESTYAKKSEIPSLEGYLQTSTADNRYATKTELEGKVDDADIADMATQTWVGEQGYLTSIPAEYITESELNAKGYKKIEYLTQSQYDELPNKEEGVMYVITDAPEVVIPDTSTFATKEELASKADASALSAKQDTLVSGTNIKTINGQTLLGSGDISIQGGNTEPKVWSTLANADFYNNAKVGDFISLSVPLTKLIIQDIRNGYGDQGTSGANKTYTCSYYIDSYTKGNEKVSGYQFIVLENDYSVTTVEIKLSTKNDLTSKQDTLVSGTNIKTVNGESILGSGNISIEGGGEPLQYIESIYTVNADNIFGFNVNYNSGADRFPFKLTSRNGIKITQDSNNAAFIEADTEVLLTKTEASTTYKTIASEWYGTQSQYDGIAEKDPNVTYYITEG